MWDLTVSVPDHCLSFYFTKHVGRWQHSCSNAAPIMIDNLLRTSPEIATCARNGHIKSVVLLFIYYWMQICYKC